MDLGNLGDAIDVTNLSSRGYSFQFELDLVKFLLLGRFWNLSYPHSHVGYREGKAAGVVLNSVDVDEGEAYTFYWGVLPQYRPSRLSLDLLYTHLEQLAGEGYRRTRGVCSLDSPMRLYRRLGYTPLLELVELEAEAAPAGSGGLEVRRLGLEEYLAEREEDGERPWPARPGFLRKAAAMLEFFGAYAGRKPAASCALSRWTGYTSLVAFDSRQPEAAAALLAGAVEQGCRPPIHASQVAAGSAAQRILELCGFHGTKRFTTIALDLKSWRRRA